MLAPINSALTTPSFWAVLVTSKPTTATITNSLVTVGATFLTGLRTRAETRENTESTDVRLFFFEDLVNDLIRFFEKPIELNRRKFRARTLVLIPLLPDPALLLSQLPRASR